MKKPFLIITALIFALSICSCENSNANSIQETEKQKQSKPYSSESETEKNEIMINGYKQITQAEAKQLMETEKNYIIVDVREQDEFDGGHIPDAILMPYESTNDLAPSLLPDKNQMILVYCRSGRRSKIAAAALAEMGYTDVREFGGIIDWQYEIVK